MPWPLWLILANISVAYVEYQYRCGDYDSFYAALPYIIAPMILGQWAIFNGFRLAPSLLIAGGVFSLINVVLRVINSNTLGEGINCYNWVGIGLLVLSVLLLRMGK